MNQNDFLRHKTTTLYESEITTVDIATGEVLHQETATKKNVSAEPDYIKVYYKAMMAVNNIAEIPLNFLLALSSQIGFTNGDSILFYNNKTSRRKIADFCKIGDNMVSKYLNRCKAQGILFSTEDRGTYEVNPWLIARGKWDSIRKLQANFDFINGRWERVVATNNESENSEANNKSEDNENGKCTNS